MPAVSFKPSTTPSAAHVAPHILLDSRRALIHETQGWMAVADLHYGYELRRQQYGALMPAWGMAECESTLIELIRDYHPQRLILAGDIMDGKSCAQETHAFLERLRDEVPELISVQGNHDRPPLRKIWDFVETHHEDQFTFSHGHRWTEGRWSDVEIFTRSDSGKAVAQTGLKTIHITGHEHPAVHLRDGAGMKLKLPALVQEQITPRMQRWILPAFSPWAMGGNYTSPHRRIGTWVCAPKRVWKTASAAILPFSC